MHLPHFADGHGAVNHSLKAKVQSGGLQHVGVNLVQRPVYVLIQGSALVRYHVADRIKIHTQVGTGDIFVHHVQELYHFGFPITPVHLLQYLIDTQSGGGSNRLMC